MGFFDRFGEVAIWNAFDLHIGIGWYKQGNWLVFWVQEWALVVTRRELTISLGRIKCKFYKTPELGCFTRTEL